MQIQPSHPFAETSLKPLNHKRQAGNACKYGYQSTCGEEYNALHSSYAYKRADPAGMGTGTFVKRRTLFVPHAPRGCRKIDLERRAPEILSGDMTHEYGAVDSDRV